MKDEPTDPPGDSSGTTAESTTKMVTTAYNAPGPPESLLPAYATTATQAVNEHAALRACCSSPDLRQNTTNTGSRPSPTAEPALPLGTILLNGPGNASALTPNTLTPDCGLACLPAVPQRWRRHCTQSQAQAQLSIRPSEVPQSAGIRGKKAQVRRRHPLTRCQIRKADRGWCSTHQW
ncbi:hypothetical protein MRX96_048974 [Rhipicephalus microplus]